MLVDGWLPLLAASASWKCHPPIRCQEITLSSKQTTCSQAASQCTRKLRPSWLPPASWSHARRIWVWPTNATTTNLAASTSFCSRLRCTAVWSRAGKLARGSRAGSSSERLGSARSGSRASNEPSLFFELVFAASRAGSFRLASRLASLAKMVNLWNNNEY
jgi:hypothetical protein